MKKVAAIGLLSFLGYSGIDVAGDQRLSVKVSPAVAVAPASLTVRAFVEPNDANRSLNVVVSSPRYERTSEVPLEGKQSQRVSVFELRDVPPGLYEITATLIGSSGRVARATQMVKVVPSPGHPE
jgi:hypothetical protein